MRKLPLFSKSSRSVEFVDKVGILVAIYTETFSASNLSNLFRISSPYVICFLLFIMFYYMISRDSDWAVPLTEVGLSLTSATFISSHAED